MEEAERAQAVADEQRRARVLRTLVDLTASVLVQGRLTRAEAERSEEHSLNSSHIQKSRMPSSA